MTDSDNVSLLRPLPRTRCHYTAAVDLFTEPAAAERVVIAQIFAVKAGSVEAFAIAYLRKAATNQLDWDTKVLSLANTKTIASVDEATRVPVCALPKGITGPNAVISTPSPRLRALARNLSGPVHIVQV